MTTKVWQGIVFLVAAAGLHAGVQADEIRVRYQENLQQLETRLHAATSSSLETEDTALRLDSLRFNAFGRHFDLQLAPNRSLLQRMPANRRPDGLGIYRGELNGVKDSWVRLTFDGEVANGLFFDGREAYAIERDDKTGSAIVFRLADVEIPPQMLSCSAIGMPQSAASLLHKISGELQAVVQSGPGATQNLDIGVVGDFEFTSDKGAGNAAAEIVTRMNNVDGIFSEQLGVQLTVNQNDTFASANDPFSDESDSGALLDEVSDYRFNNASQNSNGLTHLFTGRNLDGTTVGIAYTSAICSRRFGAGLTQATNSVTVDSLIAAHEIGHNFGAPHDGTSGSPCESTTGDWLMSPSINGSDQFSACSISEMQSVVSQASCVTALPSTDVAVAVDEVPSTPLLGNLERISFAVDSVGTEDASNVSVDVTIPGNVSLDSVSATGGTCTSGAGSTSCDLGALIAGSGAIVSLIVSLDAVGSAQFTADITAVSDANSGNNQESVSIDIAPAVDLVVTPAAAASITLNQSTTLNLTIENRASIAATSAQITISSAAGLTIDSASWPDGSCSLSGGDATCDAASLAAQASTTIALGVTGTAEGSQSYTLAASANETDRDTANNDASGTVTVNATTQNPGGGGGDDGGGGSLSWALLLLLSFGLLTRSAAALRRPH